MRSIACGSILVLLTALAIVLGGCGSTQAGKTLIILQPEGAIGIPVSASSSSTGTPFSTGVIYRGTATNLGYSYSVVSGPGGGGIKLDPANADTGGTVPSTSITFSGTPGDWFIRLTVYEVNGTISESVVLHFVALPSSG